MPPENLYYGARIRDVLAFSNSENLIAKAVDLGRGVGSGAFSERPDFRLDAPDGLDRRRGGPVADAALPAAPRSTWAGAARPH